MTDWKRQIIDPAATTAQVFAGDVMNWLVQWHSDVDLSAGDPLGVSRIATETTFRNGKIKFGDAGGANPLSFSIPSFSEPKTASFPSTMATTDQIALCAAIQVITNKGIDADANTITNIENADIKSTAAIAYSKLALTNSIVNGDIASGAAIAKSKLGALAIVDADVAAGAAIARSKLGALAITNGDVANGAAIAYSKLALSNSIVDADVAAHTSTKISITGKSQLNPNILYSDVSNNLGDNYLQFGDISAPATPGAGLARLFYNQSNSHVSVVKSSGAVTDLEEVATVVNAAFVPLTRGGTASFSGTGSQSTFTIPHTLGNVPDLVTVEPGSTDAMGNYVVTKDGTNLTVVYATPPPGGTQNVKLEWGVNTALHASSSFAAGGTAQFTATAAQTVFNIPHGLGVVPESYFAMPKTAAGMTDHRVSADTTNVIVTYGTGITAGQAVDFVWGCGFVNEAWTGFTPSSTTVITNKKVGDHLDFNRVATPTDPGTNVGRMYVKQVDANNDGLFVKLKKAGVVTEVMIA